MAAILPLRRFAIRVLPPIVTDAIRTVLRSRQAADTPPPVDEAQPVAAQKPEWEYVPGGWETVDPDVKGWNVESVVETQRAKWPGFLDSVAGTGPFGVAHEGVVTDRYNVSAHNAIMSFGYVLGLAGAGQGAASVLDWGGGIGNYFVFAKALWPKCAFDYTCKDLPLMVSAGRELLPDCRFEDDENRVFARRYDLVMASGSFHYSRDWQLLIERLCTAAERYLYVTRVPVVQHVPSFVVVQRPYAYGYHTEYLCWFLNQRELVTYVESRGFRLVREFLLDERPIVAGAPEQCRYAGLLFARHPD
jgi:putative methyltransferase (TIGR04325 family)